jgi:ferredoxin/ABC-type lipoprotein release transport system permease subunit
MKKRDFIALIWENLMRRKARVALTAVGVVVGTASILILVSLIGALKQNAAESLFGISEMRKITVMPGYGESSDEEDNFFGGMYVDAEESGQRTPTAPLNQSAVAYLTALPGVESVVLMDGLTGYGTLTFAKTEAYATILGVKTDDLGKLGVEAAEGSLELSPGTIILGASIPESFSQEDQRPGAKQSSQPDLLGKWVSIVLTKYDENGGENRKVLRLRVGGILQEGNGESDWSAYISMKDADTLNQWYTGKRANRNRNGYQQAIVLVRDPKNTLEITQQIKERGYKTFTAQSFLKGINGFFLVLQLIFTKVILFKNIGPFKVAFNLFSANITGYVLLALLLLSSVFIYRPFCRAVCPVGLILGWISRIPGASILGISNECRGCITCNTACRMDAITRENRVSVMNNPDCILCGDCLDSCKTATISFYRKGKNRNETIELKNFKKLDLG